MGVIWLFSSLFPSMEDSCSFNFLPTLHITLEGQPTFQNGLFSLPSSCLTSNIHIHTYHRQTPARLSLLPAGPGAWLGLALTMPGDQWVSWEWQGEARGGEQHIMLYN